MGWHQQHCYTFSTMWNGQESLCNVISTPVLLRVYNSTVHDIPDQNLHNSCFLINNYELSLSKEVVQALISTIEPMLYTSANTSMHVTWIVTRKTRSWRSAPGNLVIIVKISWKSMSNFQRKCSSMVSKYQYAGQRPANNLDVHYHVQHISLD